MSGSCGGADDVGRGQRGDKQSLPCYRAVIQILMADQLGYTFISFQKIFGILQKTEEKTSVTQAHNHTGLKRPHRPLIQPPTQNRRNLGMR